MLRFRGASRCCNASARNVAESSANRMRNSKFQVIFRSLKRSATAQFLAALLCFCISAIESVAGHKMRFESVEGDVTTNEYRSFIEHLEQQLPPTPSNNIGNVMVYERIGGGTLHGMQTFYAFTKDRRVLDKAVEWSDAF